MMTPNKRNSDSQKEDFYATDPIAIDYLLQVLREQKIELNENIVEPCVGEGHLANRLEAFGYKIQGFDIIDRGYKNTFISKAQDLKYGNDLSIITNPPYKYAQDITASILSKIENGQIVCMFLKLVFLESKARLEFFKQNPPKFVAVFSSRIKCAKDGDFDNYPSSTVAYAWFIWVKGYKGNPEILFIDNSEKQKYDWSDL